MKFESATHMKAPILKGSRVTLRPLTISDASNYVRWFKDKKARLYFNYLSWNKNLQEEKQWIRNSLRNKDMVNWAITIENGRHIGGTGFQLDRTHKRGRWGIIIGEKEEWGKGYAGEVIKLCGDYLFKKLNFNRLDLTVEMENKQALKAYTKAGFVFEGAMRQYQFNPGLKKYIDLGVMSILREEWIKNGTTKAKVLRTEPRKCGVFQELINN